jgi:hypothetical protein
MMNSFEVLQDRPGHLFVHAPASILLGCWGVGFFVLLSLVVWWRAGVTLRKQEAGFRVRYPELPPRDIDTTVRKMHRMATLISAGAVVAWVVLSYTSGSIDLDQTSGVATMSAKMTMFLPPQTQTAPLSSLTGAVLDFKPNEGRIRLTASNGNDMSYPTWSDRSGQQEAVQAINRFLATRPEKGR